MSNVAEPREPILNAEVATMVREIGKVGPKVPEVARRLGRHKETVRYWYKKLEDHDFAIQAIVNQEALGLRRLVFKVQFEELYADFARPLMFALNELAYVVGCAKTIADDTYVVNASVPSALVPEYLSFMDSLKEQGVFRSVESYRFDWIRNIPMDGTFYDFEDGRWEFDLTSLVKAEVPFTEPTASEVVKFDRLDLLVAKELQTDATRETREIRRAIKEIDKAEINYKTLCWHLDQHVKANGLVKGYRINWMGTRWDPVTDKARQRSHSFSIFDILVKQPSPEDKLKLMKSLNHLPLVWAEAGGEDYFAELAIPNELLIDVLSYLQRVTDGLSERTSYLMIDQKNAIAFTFSYNLYDEASKSWSFNKEDLLAKFKALEIQIKGQ